MEVSVYGFFDLAVGVEAFIAFRKSRLMLASNRLVGIFFNSALFSTGLLCFSMRNLL
jgi:hypothetical protein